MKFEVTELPKRKISDLKPHPKNIEIYGEESIVDLVKEIKSSRYVSPLMITQDNIIVSGHRRQRACIELGIDEVEVVVRHFDNDIDVLEALVLENDYREKTNLQKANESETLLTVEKERAKLRMSLGGQGGVNKGVAESPPLDEPIKTGKVRDLVAEQVGFKSGREVERAISAAKAIKEAEKSGDTEKAEILKGQLERSPSAADDLVRNWDKVDKEKLEEQKEDLKSGKKSAYGLIPREEPKKKKESGDKEKSNADDWVQPLPRQAPKQRLVDYILAGIGLIGTAVHNISNDFEAKLPDIKEESERQELRTMLRDYINQLETLYTKI